MKYFNLIIFLLAVYASTLAQTGTPKRTDSNTPLHALQPDYPVPYTPATAASVKQVAERILFYLDSSTHTELLNKSDGRTMQHVQVADSNTILKPGDFRLLSYEWGVTYAGML